MSEKFTALSAFEQVAIQQHNKMLMEALQVARNGIKWYIENDHEANGCDDEVLEQIDVALAFKPEKQPKPLPKCSVCGTQVILCK